MPTPESTNQRHRCSSRCAATICWALGHRYTEPTQGVEHCPRCDDTRAFYYDGSNYWTEWERYGRLKLPVLKVWWKLRSLALPRCHECGKLLVAKRYRGDYESHFCSPACRDRYIPF